MDLTEEEKCCFRVHDEDLTESPAYHVESGLTGSYTENNDTVRITYGYIKRILIEVAKKRNLEIPDDITFDMDDLLKKIIEVPEELGDFDVLNYKKYDELSKYVEGKVEGMCWDDMDSFRTSFFWMTDSFRSFMGQYIPKLSYNIDMLNNEIDAGNCVKLEDSKGITIIEGEQEDDEWIDWEEAEESGDITITEGEPDDTEWVDWEEFEGSGDITVIEGEQDDIEWADGEEDDRTKITDEELIDLIRYINSYPQLFEYKSNGNKVHEELRELVDKTKLREFYSDKEFYEDFKKIMAHDPKKNRYRFHGTQDLESASTIISEGLGMMRENLDTTSYKEFTMDQVILYSRGLGGEIGSLAIVIIDEPIGEDGKIRTVVEPLAKDKKIHFAPSGLQGLNGKLRYIVNPQYIVGYVDKFNKKIIYNPRYYDYERFNLQPNNTRPKGTPFDDERIAEGVLSFNPSELEIPNNELEN